MNHQISPNNAADLEIDWMKVDRAFGDHCKALGMTRESGGNAAGITRVDVTLMCHRGVDHSAKMFLRICAWCEVDPFAFCEVKADV